MDWGFWSLSEPQVISHPLYLGLSQPAATQEQLQAQAKVESSGGFSKRHPIPDDKVLQGHRIPTTFLVQDGSKNGFTKLAVGSRQQHKHCTKVTKVFPKLRPRYPKLRHLWIIMSPHVTTQSWVTKMRWYTCIGVFPSWKKNIPAEPSTIPQLGGDYEVAGCGWGRRRSRCIPLVKGCCLISCLCCGLAAKLSPRQGAWYRYIDTSTYMCT